MRLGSMRVPSHWRLARCSVICAATSLREIGDGRARATPGSRLTPAPKIPRSVRVDMLATEWDSRLGEVGRFGDSDGSRASQWLIRRRHGSTGHNASVAIRTASRRQSQPRSRRRLKAPPRQRLRALREQLPIGSRPSPGFRGQSIVFPMISSKQGRPRRLHWPLRREARARTWPPCRASAQPRAPRGRSHRCRVAKWRPDRRSAHKRSCLRLSRSVRIGSALSATSTRYFEIRLRTLPITERSMAMRSGCSNDRRCTAGGTFTYGNLRFREEAPTGARRRHSYKSK